MKATDYWPQLEYECVARHMERRDCLYRKNARDLKQYLRRCTTP